jgi:pimeloyl-ACP methyl ester carboxylesterase
MKNLRRNSDNTFEWRINIGGIEPGLGSLLDAVNTTAVFEKPTLFIKGGKSDYILLEDFPVIRKNFPNAEIVTIAGTSHWVHVEAPEVFYQLTMGFLTGNPDWFVNDKSVKKA